MKIYIIAIFIFFGPVCMALGTNPEYQCGKPNCSVDVVSVSLIKLIADPSSFNGKRVRVSGYVSLEFEGTAIYLDETQYEYMNSENSIWLGSSKWLRENTECHLNYCFVEGTFDSKEIGHFGAFSGALKDIYRIDKSLTRDEVSRIRLRSNQNISIEASKKLTRPSN